MTDRDGDEGDSKDEVMFPGDFEEAGHILDDEVYREFVSQIPDGVHVVALMDCCHSGSAMDLPYQCGPGEEQFHQNAGFKPVPGGLGGGAAPKKKAKAKKQATKKKADEAKKGGKKKAAAAKKKKEEGPAADEEEAEEPPAEEPKKKKKGFFGFGRKKK